MIELIHGDCLEEMKKLAVNSIDAIVCDPPYELGFMGKSWDSTGIANNVQLWGEALRVLKPGGHLLAFSGTRTYHRMASAIEDAGFEVRDMIEWVYGSGFPKSLNIGKAVDKLQGNEREQTKNNVTCPDFPNPCKGHPTANRCLGGGVNRHATPTKGTSEWEGWGTALKPAHEPICMARKPLAEKTVAENVLKWGTGGINIDESRVGTEEMKFTRASTLGNNLNMEGGKAQEDYVGEDQIGRFPANLIHDNSEEVRECFPESNTKSTKIGNSRYKGKQYAGEGYYGTRNNENSYTDSGNASRFFKSIAYYPKASKSERNKGCEGLEETSAPKYGSEKRITVGGSKDTALPRANHHPTVKPIALMEYLIKMVSKEGATILDPFMGSGSTGVAAKQCNRNFIGIELDKDYYDIAVKRIHVV
jgi:DNA modification methylase